MKRLFFFALCLVGLVGCRGTSYPRMNQRGVSNVTYAAAFSDYRRVYRATYAVMNAYTLIKYASYRRGVIVGEFLTNQELLDKTRTLVYATIKRKAAHMGDARYWDVEIRALKQRDTSLPDYFSRNISPYRWRTVYYDQKLELQLLNRVKLVLTKKGYLQKRSLARGVVGENVSKKRGAFEVGGRGGVEGGGKVSSGRVESDGKASPGGLDGGGSGSSSLETVRARPMEGELGEVISEDGVARDSRSYRHYVLLGEGYFCRGRWQMAEIAFSSAFGVAETGVEREALYYYLAATYIGLGKPDRAWRAFLDGLRMQDRPRLELLSKILADEHQLFYLISRLGKGFKARILRAFLFLGAGRKEEGRRILEGVMSSDVPDYFRFYLRKLWRVLGGASRFF